MVAAGTMRRKHAGKRSRALQRRRRREGGERERETTETYNE